MQSAQHYRSLYSTLFTICINPYSPVMVAGTVKQGVVITGRNTTGPPCSVSVEL